jgi:hypothetical protein
VGCRRARVISAARRMADIKPDEQIVVHPELDKFDVYRWTAKTSVAIDFSCPHVGTVLAQSLEL